MTSSYCYLPNKQNVFNNTFIKHEGTGDKKALFYTNNSRDVTLEMVNEISNEYSNSNLRAPSLKNSVSILNPNANIFTSKVNKFEMLLEPFIYTRNFGYTIRILP